ncbi:small subunit processome component 20 homolog [Lucilia sericata]|uniref:small subunit processome component 20 homolog n=1 Tax=Lucilia sericata TaxID=13632 RepID=UPI0018A842A7|nr:small subunit processome component 20 homolog [Lucilia sericata]
MAEQQQKTKNSNTFRFKSFADRVNEIDLRRLALYHIGHENEELPEEENETFFHQTLKKWMVLNLSEEYSLFSRKVIKVVTLPQLLHQKDFVVDLLLEKLACATNLSLQPLLELLYVLARDLREEFYPYFQRVLDRLICLLNTQDAEQLEWTLVCLAYLFKALKPYLKRNIGVVFNCILPLLDERRYEEHVTNFAVECFSFIARDVRDYGKFLEFILETIVREQVESVQGCGRLLFEIMRGVKGQFHSIAGDFLQFIFESLVEDKKIKPKQSQLLNDIVEYCISQVLKFIQPQQMSLFWLKLCEVSKNCLNPAKLQNLCRIFLQVVEYKECRFLAEMDVIVPCLLHLVDVTGKHITECFEALRTCTQVISCILLSGSSLVTQLDTSRLLKKSLSIKEREIYAAFVKQMTLHVQFEIFILPSLVQHFEEFYDKPAFELLAEVLLKRQPLQFNALSAQKWQPLDIKVKSAETLKKLEQNLKKFKVNDQQMEEQLLMLLIAPHLKGLQQELLKKPLNSLIQTLLKELENNAAENQLNLLCLIITIYLQLKFALNPQTVNTLTPVLIQNCNNLRCLGVLNLLIFNYPQLFKELPELRLTLAQFLAHHDHEKRLLAAHTLSLIFKAQEQQTPYHIFYQAELIEPTVHNYREQVLLVQKLETQAELFKQFKEDFYKEDCVRFLLGLLYHNFKYVWEPVLKLLEDYAKQLDVSKFWLIYQEKLQTTQDNIDYQNSKNNQDLVVTQTWQSPALNDLLCLHHQPTLSQQQLFNYRNLLWQRLPQFGKLVELKNRELVTMFMKFVEEEYQLQLESKENSWDLSVKSQNSLDIEDIEEDNEQELQQQPAQTTSFKKKSKYLNKLDSSNIKSILQTLQTKLAVFAAHQNPRALYREAELKTLYLRLLKGSNQQLQKSALDCLFSYKSKALIPYKDLLYNMLDEKKFKDELINFKVDTVSLEHRQEFMEILLRLLYGKMITKGSQKGLSPQQRKSIILRFLAQCSLEEIEWFLQMAFGLYGEFCQDSTDILAIPSLVQKQFNMQQVWSPKKLQSVVNLLELIRKEFGGIMQQKFHYYMLKLLVFIGCVCNEVFSLDSSLIHPKMPLVFRNLKHNCLQSVYNFFEHIEDFEWSEDLIKCLSEVFIYPSLEKLPVESIHSPTVLLKLLLLWGEKPKHFKFLNQNPPHKQENIFHFIISLLLNEKSKALVRKPIMALVERLLVASENELEFADEGLQLVKPYIPELLQRLKMNFSTKGSKQQLDKRDLNVLSLLTKHVTEPETCDSLLQLLLPILIAKTQTQSSNEVVAQVITTLANLIKRLEKPELYIRKIAPLFEQVQEVCARKQLCDLIADIARIKHKQNPSSLDTQQLKSLARIILLLNSWDKRWVEQPDYEKRLEAFKEIKQQTVSKQGVDLDLGILVIYNCFYFLRHDKDMGLRDNASESLKLLLPHLTKKYSGDKIQIDYLVGDVFINLIRRVIKDSHENVRNEGIRLLGEMARECPESHEILQDLHGLGDKLDVEVDFFENMIHLQSHRHGRALLKFNTYAASLEKPPCVRTLTQFVLPLASRYLLQEQHASKHTLIDAAIETVGIVCQLLPWQHYHSILRYYLMKMRLSHDYQKQCVRIVVRILDAFHYDLSLAQKDQQTLEKLKNVIKEKAEEFEVDIKTSKPEEEQKVKQELKEEEEDEDEEENKPKANEEETLEQALEKQEDEEEDDDDSEEENNNSKPIIKQEPCLNKITVLPSNASKKVLTTITTILIPTLNRSITDKSSYDVKHKVNRKRLSMEREEEEILRVPIGLALVKLMQKLPQELMDTSLPGVFMKVCTFLRSPLKSVRMLTRDILKKIMLCLGSKYLPMLMDHLQNLLTRGFQVHVLSVTVHGVLDALRDCLQPQDIESCLHNLLEVALNDIFGEISAEKEIDKLTSHTPEAKPSAKSFLVLHIIARNIREICLLDLLMPFKDHLAKSKSRKLTLKIQEAFAKIVNGLVENPHISRESLLIFIYGTMSESITDLLPGVQRRVLSEQEKEKMRRARPDCFIIQPVPRNRSGAVNKQVKTNAQANAHILIEFGLEMLHIVLKRKKLVEVDYPPFLNPILPLLKDSLKSTHIRVTTFALKCFATLWVEEYKLSNMEEPEYIKAVVERMFEILKNFSTFGASKQEDNFQLMKSAFKAIVALLRKCQYYNLTEEQIDELVLYIEQDLHEGENQNMTFNLLKAMLTRKIESKAMHDIMKRIGDMSITSHSDYVRDEARNLLTTYVMEYPLHKRVDQIVKFFTVQLCYSLSAGRLSAIEFLCTIIKKFPLTILSKRAEFLYLSLGSRLVNDEEPECRKAVANCIEIMIGRLEKADRQQLFDMTLLFFNAENKPSVREMAAALCSRFLMAEKQSFAPRIKLLLPILIGRMTTNSSKPGRFVRAPHALAAEDLDKPKAKKSKKTTINLENEVQNILHNDEEQNEAALLLKQKALDHELIQMQYCLLKIFDYCSEELFKNDEISNLIDELAYESQRLLAHEHNWVRCNAAKIISHIISGFDLPLIGRKLAQIVSEEDEKKRIKMDFIYLNPEYDIKSLVLDLCAQMIPGDTAQPMIDEIVKIFLYVATMLREVPFKVKREVEQEVEEVQEDNKESLTKINLNWLMKNIRFLINKEVAKAPHSTSMRTALFTLIEALITLLTVETLELLGPSLLTALVREMSEEDQNIDAELRQLALRVGSRLRKRLGSDLYDKLRAAAQMKLMVRRAERRKLIAQEKIHDPVRAAKRKVAVQERKKSSKKLKASVIRGKTADVKQKLKKRKRKAEEDLF